MQPKDFEEEVALSGERLEKKKKRFATMNKWKTLGFSTPTNSPAQPQVLAEDTQPRSPEVRAIF